MTSRPTVPDPFGARATLRAGSTDYDYHRLGAVADRLDLDSLPVTIKILLENLLRHAGGGVVRDGGRRDPARLAPGLGGRGGDPVHAGAGPAPGLHRRPGGGGPGGHARRDGRSRWRPLARESARAGRPRDRSFGPDRPVRDAGRVRLQRRARVRPQRRALPAAALGADRVPRPARRATRDRHRPPGQPRVPGHRVVDRRR